VEVDGSVDAVGSLRIVHFKDGSVQKFRVLELSGLRFIVFILVKVLKIGLFTDSDHFVTYEVIESSTPTLVLAAVHSIRLRRVTHNNATFVDITSEFSSGSSTALVIEDSKYKKIELLQVC
jgi:hypothetical protein